MTRVRPCRVCGTRRKRPLPSRCVAHQDGRRHNRPVVPARVEDFTPEQIDARYHRARLAQRQRTA